MKKALKMIALFMMLLVISIPFVLAREFSSIDVSQNNSVQVNHKEVREPLKQGTSTTLSTIPLVAMATTMGSLIDQYGAANKSIADKCNEKASKSDQTLNFMDNSVITVITAVLDVARAICLTLGAIDTVLSSIGSIIGFLGPDSACCNAGWLSIGIACGKEWVLYTKWEAFYGQIKVICCYVTCGWCSGGCYGSPDIKKKDGDKGTPSAKATTAQGTTSQPGGTPAAGAANPTTANTGTPPAAPAPAGQGPSAPAAPSTPQPNPAPSSGTAPPQTPTLAETQKRYLQLGKGQAIVTPPELGQPQAPLVQPVQTHIQQTNIIGMAKDTSGSGYLPTGATNQGTGQGGGIYPGTGIAYLGLTPYENIYTAIACLCPGAVLDNLKKLRAIYQTHGCCVKQACQQGLSTESCDSSLDQSLCMFWEGALISALAKMIVHFVITAIIKYIGLTEAQFLLIKCILSVFELIETPQTIQSIMSQWQNAMKAFGTPNCEDLGFKKISDTTSDITKDLKSQTAVTFADVNGDGYAENQTQALQLQQQQQQAQMTAAQLQNQMAQQQWEQQQIASIQASKAQAGSASGSTATTSGVVSGASS